MPSLASGRMRCSFFSGVKRVENRRAMPVPREGRCAISVSKKFSAKEYENFPKPIPCHGNVGMWQMDDDLQAKIANAVLGHQA